MDLKLAAFRALLNDQSSNYTAVAVAVAALVTFGLVIVLALIATILPGRRAAKRGATAGGSDARGATSGEAMSATHDEAGSAVLDHRVEGSVARRPPLRRRLRRGFAGAALVTVIVVAGIIGAGALWYRGTSSDTYCAHSCHSMSKAALSWENSPHSAVPCTTCHESANRRAIPKNVITRLSYIYLQAIGGSARPDPVPSARCLACHTKVLDEHLTARNGETFTHREVLVETPACETCHDRQGHRSARR